MLTLCIGQANFVNICLFMSQLTTNRDKANDLLSTNIKQANKRITIVLNDP